MSSMSLLHRGINTYRQCIQRRKGSYATVRALQASASNLEQLSAPAASMQKLPGRHWKKCETAEEAVSIIQSGHRCFIHGGSATPSILLNALCRQHDRLKEVELCHMHIHGKVPYDKAEFKKAFRVANYFCGENVRKALDYDRIDYIPIFLSEIPKLMKEVRPIDVALIHVSPPDSHGYCTLGTSVDCAHTAVQTAKLVIAQVNPQMPRVHGDGFVHVSQIDNYVEIDEPLHESNPAALSENEIKIGQLIAELVEDGSTLQMGIGAIPNAVLSQLTNHKHLGIHTEMWSDGALPLLESGVIDNSMKEVHPWKSVSAFIVGSRKVYEFIHDNPSVIQSDVHYVNNPLIILKNPKVCAINSAVEIDLTGQICADSVGTRIVSGVGGQMDFMRGAALSPGGKPIMALTSRSANGSPRIVNTLQPGAGVVTTRPHAHYVATEYGVAYLYGKTLNERAKELIKIAHPDDREGLERAWTERKRRGEISVE